MECNSMKMLWIGLLTTFQLWGSIVAQQQTENIRTTEHPYTTDLYSVFLTALKDLRACKSLTLCELVERFRIPLQDFSKFSSSTSERRKGTYYDEVKPRSYYNTYGAPAAPAHTYVPAFLGFDPISILASLAFLAFLIQSFVSLFDRSRSIIPTIVSSRQSLEASIQDIAERVFRAMDRYELFNEKTSEEKPSENTV
ncbi:uncharacterized protein LOC124297355 isoform X1 [Neodiprion virginianus]|uniref:uncharacterized protein LOC124297355 isoform X1 n=2 Tax=Neodiprion virginianus TaxID=2961670 RepID=UPI001EE754B2|nr:uncharacterized protein LOC124297355 isoform X1 [Neodiprion virginianus]